MALFNISFNVLGSFGIEAPRVAFYYGGVKISQFYAGSAITPYTFELDTDNFNHTQIRFVFLDSGTETNRTVTIADLVVGGVDSDMSAFTASNGAIVGANNVVLEQDEYSDYDTADDLGIAPPVILGTAGVDKLFANDLGNHIDAQEGNDVLYGGTGADVLYGGSGNDNISGKFGDDEIHGGADNDFLWGGYGDDILYGDEGDDQLRGDDGNDQLFGGIGSDRLYAGHGDDYVEGGDGDDFIYAQSGINTLNGGAGNDRISGGSGNDIIDGGADQDNIHGWDGDDTLRGGDGNDVIAGDDGNDIIFGDAGNDQLIGDAGNDTLHGGEGADRLVGHTGDDTLNGDAGDDIIEGREGADILNGGTGNDRLFGGDGADILNGGDGDDVLYAYNTVVAEAETFQGRILADNPVVYYQLNELSGTSALNQGTAGATLNGTYIGTTLGHDALFSGGETSAAFDGVNDYISVPNSNLINTSNITERTIELVFNAHRVTGRQVLYEEGGGTNAMVIYIDEGQLYFNVRDGSGTQWGPFNISSPVVAGETYHAALVMDTNAGYVQGYVNGNLVGSGSALTLLSSHSGQIGIGGVNNDTYFHDGAFSGNGHYFDGQITDVAIHNDPLDQATLQARYNALTTGGSTASFNDGDDVLNGGAGNDTIHLSNGNDSADGGDGNDVIFGGIGSNIIIGGAGNDVIYADGQQVNAPQSTLIGLNSSILNKNPVAYWNFADTSGTTANNLGALNNSGDGTYENGVTLNAGGIYGNDDSSADFDGVDDRVQINDSASINTSVVSLRTIEVIFSADTTTGQQVIYEEGGTINALAIYIENGRLYFNGTDRSGPNWGSFDISTSINAGETYHAALVLDAPGGELRGYLNGSLVGTGVVDGPLSAHSGDIGIGWSDGGAFYHDGADGTTGYYFDGQISEVVVYNEALSQSDLQEHVGLMDGSFTFSDPIDDTINGGDGFDQLYAGSGRDLFVFESSSAFNDVDHIFDYSVSEGDSLDISDLLTGFNPGSSDINDFLRFTNSGSDTLIQVDTNGGANSFQTIGQLNGVNDVDADQLYSAGAIIV